MGRDHHGVGDSLNSRKAGPRCQRSGASPLCWSSCVKSVVPPSLTCSGKLEHPSKNSSLQLPKSPPFPIQHSGGAGHCFSSCLLCSWLPSCISILETPSYFRLLSYSDLSQCSYHLGTLLGLRLVGELLFISQNPVLVDSVELTCCCSSSAWDIWP